LKYININGKLIPSSEASVPYDNRAFRYGYGLFETILYKDDTIQLKELHWERLFSGLVQLHFDIPKLMSPEYLENEIIRTVKKNKLEKLCRIRLQVYADSGGLYADSPKPEFIIECFEIEPAIIQLNENGLTVGIATGLKKSIDTLSNLKTTNALIYAMAAQQAKANKWNDAFIYNTDGHIIESTIANIFWIKDNMIYTPPLSSGCVAGVMRSFIISSLAGKGINVIEKNISEDELAKADEVFLTNTIRRMKWVKVLGSNNLYQKRHIQNVDKMLFN